MPSSSASVKTEHASRYLQQLCKHWSHRFSVDFTAEAGTIVFDEKQTVSLLAEGDQLGISITDETPELLAQLQDVVIEHLQRFAHRETLQFEWHQASQD